MTGDERGTWAPADADLKLPADKEDPEEDRGRFAGSHEDHRVEPVALTGSADDAVAQAIENAHRSHPGKP